MHQLLYTLLVLIPAVNSLPVNNQLQLHDDFTDITSLIAVPDSALVSADVYNARAIDPEAYMEINEIIRYHGYPVEDHIVNTDDGYELTIQRIPYGKAGPGNKPRKPVLVQHGLLCSSSSWVTNTPDKNLPYILADRGYDIWLGNIRGTLFGRKHKYLNPKHKEFWAYSFDEMAKYDIPKVIDMILNVTGYKQLYYIGHSMGTTMGFAMLSTQPEYNDKVKGMFALAPVATVGHVRSPLRIIAPFSTQAGWILNMLGPGEFLFNDRLLKMLSSTVCNSPLKVMCESILFLMCGFSQDQLNSTRLPVYLHHTPAATSVQNLVHFGQMVQSKKFQFHDFGFTANKERYGQGIPPQYNVKNIKTPVALFWSDNDYLADPNDVSWLANQLPSLILKYRVPEPRFSHLDFLWAIDVNRLLYNKLVNVMDKLWKD